LAGYAARFGVDAIIAGAFVERIAYGAFRDALGSRADVVGLFNHDANIVLGRTTAGTLRLEETADGLAFGLDVNEADPLAAGVLARVRRGDIRGCSFSFSIDRESWAYPKDALPVRTILRVGELSDVGPVTWPAYDRTSVTTLDDAGARRRAPEWSVQLSRERLRLALKA
jgi:HK97 family phage prohead protease